MITSSQAPVRIDISQRIPELDGIRGLAILLVLYYHYVVSIVQVRPRTFFAHVLTLGNLTWSGVDLFFVLSGFLIGGILFDARGSATLLKTFYARRFFRIVPLWFVVWTSARCKRNHRSCIAASKSGRS